MAQVWECDHCQARIVTQHDGWHCWHKDPADTKPDDCYGSKTFCSPRCLIGWAQAQEDE